jgi:NTP pyrophosphatase (non-canonical NTP hydrolase)
MTPHEYQTLALRTDSDQTGETIPGSTMRVLHGALGCGSEAGELLGAVKKHLFYRRELDRINVIEECGDLLWYIALTLDAVGTTMDEAMERNLAKLRARYPDRFTAEKATSRDLEKEREALEGRGGWRHEDDGFTHESDLRIAGNGMRSWLYRLGQSGLIQERSCDIAGVKRHGFTVRTDVAELMDYADEMIGKPKVEE